MHPYVWCNVHLCVMYARMLYRRDDVIVHACGSRFGHVQRSAFSSSMAYSFKHMCSTHNTPTMMH